jgi:hypothetical protein
MGEGEVISNTPPRILNEAFNGEQKPLTILDRLAPPPKVGRKDVSRVKGLKIVRSSIIGGTGVEYLKGYPGVAVLKAREGLWEQSRGHKVDGGERRKAEVRSKRAAMERKNAR